jgi:hypothetical protein
MLSVELLPFQEGNYPKQKNCSYQCGYQASDQSIAHAYSQQVEDPAADKCADNAYYDIHQQPEAASTHNVSREPARYCSDDDKPQPTHKQQFLVNDILYRQDDPINN